MPLLIFFVVLGSMEQARWYRVYITLRKKLFGFLCLILWPMGFVFLALVEQLGFLVLKQLVGTIHCSCFHHSGHDAGPLHSIQTLKCFCAASLSQMITMI